MNRRGFLTALLSSAAAVAIDPERLLWVPGRKLISIPAPASTLTMMPIGQRLNKGDIFSMAGVYQVNPKRRDKQQFFTVTRVLDDFSLELRPTVTEDYPQASAILFQEEMTKTEFARRYVDEGYGFRRR